MSARFEALSYRHDVKRMVRKGKPQSVALDKERLMFFQRGSFGLTFAGFLLRELVAIRGHIEHSLIKVQTKHPRASLR